MYISSFHIDGFGIFSNVEVGNLQPGINIFLGRNEAGKSTCLEFLRVMLTGYPTGKRADNTPPPPPGATPGGSLILFPQYETLPETIYLTRRPRPYGGLILAGPDGANLPEKDFEKIFAGVNREVYRHVFGFSLGELEKFETFNEESVKNALYGASFGPGLRSPAAALKILKKRQAEIFRPGGSVQPLNATLRQDEEMRANIRDLAAECASYDSLCESLEEKKKELANLRARKTDLELEKAGLEKRLQVWDCWNEWRGIKYSLERLPEIPENFPQDALKRFDMIQAAAEACEQRIAARKTRLDSLRERRGALHADGAILAKLPFLKRLAERKNSYRVASSQIEAQKENVDRLERQLAETLALLGGDWDCDRIRATDRSLFSREALALREKEMTSAMQSHQAALDNLTTVNQEVGANETALASAEKALEDIPEIDTLLSEQERDELRGNMARLEETGRMETAREKALKLAIHSLERALEQAHIQKNGELHEQNLEQIRSIIENILATQQDGLDVAGELRRFLTESENLSNRLNQLGEHGEAIKKRMEDLLTAARRESASTRDSLETRSRALRSIRDIVSKLSAIKERQRELETRMDSNPFPSRIIHWPLFVFGILSLLSGGVAFLASQIWDIHEIVLNPTFHIPLNLPLIYGLVTAGVLFMAVGMPPNGAEKKRYHQEMAQLNSARENCVMQMVELDQQARDLCAVIGIESTDAITLDATEMLLEREKEQFIHEERTKRDMLVLQKEYDEIDHEMETLRKTARLKENDIQKCRKKWHSLMEGLQVRDCPSPESATTVYARVEAAKIAWENVYNTQKELDGLWEDLHVLESAIASVPPVAKLLESSSESPELQEAAARILEECKEADRVGAERARAKGVLKTVENELERARKRQENATVRLEQAAARLDEARGAWSEDIVKFGLGENLEPQAMHEALRLMETSLQLESQLAEAKRALTQSGAEIEALETPLRSLVRELERFGTEDQQTGYLSLLDNLLEDAEHNAVIRGEEQKLDSIIADHEDDCNSSLAELETIKNREKTLFVQAGVDNIEDFLRLSKLYDEHGRLLKEISNLESSLSVAAGNQPLEAFLHTFEEGDRDAQTQKLAECGAKLIAISDQEQRISALVGALEAKTASLDNSVALAELRQSEAMLEESIQRMALSWAALAFAESILNQAKHKFESERQPQVIALASKIFAQITGERWGGIRATLDDSKLEILSKYGDPVNPSHLSRGTQEQAWLALRLAYIRNHGEHATPLPVIMDEILVNFDPERSEKAAKAFVHLCQGFSEEKRQQILYFTCQPHMVDILRSAAPEATLFMVENGGIHAA